MKRATGFVFPSGFFQWDTAADDFYDIGSVDQIIDEVLGYAAGHMIAACA
jgi:hypothetical protein